MAPMTRQGPYPTIGLIGNLGNGNLGDEATAASIICAFRERFPRVEFIAFTYDIADTVQRHGIIAEPGIPGVSTTAQAVVGEAAAPSRSQSAGGSGVAARTKHLLRSIPMIRRMAGRARSLLSGTRAVLHELGFLPTCVRNVRRVDLMVVAGGGQISDQFYGPWNFPYKLLKWAVLARLFHRKFIFMNVGASRLTSPLSKIFVRWALRLAHYKSFRDETSERVARQIGLEDSGGVFPDLVFGLPVAPAAGGTNRAGRRHVVGVNVFPHRDPRYAPDGDSGAYQDYLKMTASYVRSIVGEGYDVLVFPTQVRADVWVIDELMEMLSSEQGVSSVSRADVTSIGDLVNALNSVDIVVATRFHALVFCLLLGKPVVALANQDKMIDLMKSMNQDEYLLDVDKVKPTQVSEKLRELVESTAHIQVHYQVQVRNYKKLLDKQYDEILWPRLATLHDSAI